MMIWRNLDPKLLGELLVAAAQAHAEKRKTAAEAPPPALFRVALAVAAAPHRLARHRRA
jgi:hypothetical protein